MKRLLLLFLTVSVLLLALALPGQAVPPPSQSPVDVSVTKEAPYVGKQFTGVFIQVDQAHRTDVHIGPLSCQATLLGRPLPCKIQTFLIGPWVAGLGVGWKIPKSRGGALKLRLNLATHRMLAWEVSATSTDGRSGVEPLDA